MVRLKSALRRILLTHCSIWLLLTAALPAIAVAETQYLYDDLGRLVLVAYPDGSAIAYEHDADGNIVAQHQWTAAEPVIATFSPTQGHAGMQVTISGVGFHPTPSVNTVTIGGAPATVDSASDTMLVVTVPLDAQTGRISVETGGQVATSAQDFIVRKPSVASFSPIIANPGDPVLLQGSNLNLVPGSTSISVAGVVANITSLTNSDAVFDAPAASGQIVVDTSYGQALSVGYLTVVPASIGAANVVDISTLEPGLSGTLNVDQADKYGVLEFDATQGQRFGLRIASLNTMPAGADVSYELFSPTGVSLLSGTVSVPSTIHLPQIPTTGRHLITFTSPGSAAVQLTAELLLYPVLELSDTSQSFSSMVPGQVGYFTFTATAGEDLSIGLTELTLTPHSWVRVHVDSPSGGNWTYRDCYTSNNPGCAIELRDAPETGEYSVRVVPKLGAAMSSYVLTLSHYLDGGVLALDASKSMVMTAPGQRGLLEFTVTSGQTVALAIESITLTPAGQRLYVYVYDSSGALVTQTYGISSTTLNLSNLAADTYTVVLVPQYAATGAVQVTLASGLIGTLPADGTSQSFSSTVPGQVGYFTFMTTAGEDLSIGLTELTLTPHSWVRVYVDLPSGGNWTYRDCYTSNNPGCTVELRDAPETGEYAVRVTPMRGPAMSSYVLTLSRHLEAGALVLDTPKPVTIAVPGQQAWLDFTLPAPQTVALAMDSIAMMPSGHRMYLTLYDSSGTQIRRVHGTSSVTLNFPDLAADTYRVWLSPSSAATGAVQVTLASGLIGTLPADGTSQSFSSTVPGQVGYFTFMTTAGEDLSIGLTELTLTPHSWVRVYVDLPSGGNWTYRDCYTSNNPGCTVELRDAPETGEYAVRVTPMRGPAMSSYVLTLSRHLEAGALVLDTPKPVTIAVPGQQAWLDFTLPAPQTVALAMDSIAMMPSGHRMYLTLYDSSGTQIRRVHGTSSVTLNFPDLAADTYRVWLSPSSAATGSVQVTLR